jgi:NAD(P)-dependent dehydrogenase (short-subunit alcohol dehydrogenase family)
VERVLDTARAFGGLDGLVHCAAIVGPIGAVINVDPEAWWDAVRINLFGTFLIARATCQRMIATRTPGSIVLMSGGGAASPFPRYTAYASGKVGVVRFTETLALEVAEHGIRVNCVAPGFVATRMHEQTLAAGTEAAGEYLDTTIARLENGAVPASVAARTVAFLLSRESQGITGRFVAAAHDGWDGWPQRLEQIQDSELFTLRRIVPRDRGMDWQ